MVRYWWWRLIEAWREWRNPTPAVVYLTPEEQAQAMRDTLAIHAQIAELMKDRPRRLPRRARTATAKGDTDA